MTLDQQLRDELQDVAGRVGEPTLDVTALVAAGAKGRAVQRRRTRIKWVGVAAAAAAAVVAVPLALGGLALDERPAVVASEPGATLTAADVPYVKGGVIHVGGATIESPYGDDSPKVTYANGHTIVWGAMSPTGDLLPAYRVADGRLEELPASAAATPMLSPDGKTVVWADARLVDEGVKNSVTVDTVSLSVADASTGEVTRELPLPGTGGAGVAGVDNQGRVFFADERGSWIWMPDGIVIEGKFAEAPLNPMSVAFTTPDGFLVDVWEEVQSKPRSGETVHTEMYTVSIEADGSFGERRDLPPSYGRLSPDGSRFAYLKDQAIWILDLTSGEKRQLFDLTGTDATNAGPGRMPSDGWAGDFVVLDLIPSDAEPSSRVVCDVPASACEIQQY